MSQIVNYIAGTSEDTSSKKDLNLLQIIVFIGIYLFIIFTAQSWIAAFTGYYQKYVIKKEKPEPQDFLVLSLILTVILVVAIYWIHPRLPLFK